jgi:hypothetical protein
LCGDAIHAVCGRTCEDLLFAGYAEGADKGVDGFIGADADEEVGGCDGLGGVGVGVAEVAEELLEFFLVAIRMLVYLESNILACTYGSG